MKRLVVLFLPLLCAGLVFGSGPSEEFTSAEGKFKVTFPGKPKAQTQKAAGVTMKVHVLEQGDGAYFVGYGDMPIPEDEPAAKIKDRFDGAVAGMAQSTGG